jgi:hypothetical protein
MKSRLLLLTLALLLASPSAAQNRPDRVEDAVDRLEDLALTARDLASDIRSSRDARRTRRVGQLLEKAIGQLHDDDLSDAAELLNDAASLMDDVADDGQTGPMIFAGPSTPRKTDSTTSMDRAPSVKDAT